MQIFQVKVKPSTHPTCSLSDYESPTLVQQTDLPDLEGLVRHCPESQGNPQKTEPGVPNQNSNVCATADTQDG